MKRKLLIIGLLVVLAISSTLLVKADLPNCKYCGCYEIIKDYQYTFTKTNYIDCVHGYGPLYEDLREVTFDRYIFRCAECGYSYVRDIFLKEVITHIDIPQ